MRVGVTKVLDEVGVIGQAVDGKLDLGKGIVPLREPVLEGRKPQFMLDDLRLQFEGEPKKGSVENVAGRGLLPIGMRKRRWRRDLWEVARRFGLSPRGLRVSRRSLKLLIAHLARGIGCREGLASSGRDFPWSRP